MFGMKYTIHRSQKVLKMLSPYTQTFLAPAEEVLITLKAVLQEYLQFPCEYIFSCSIWGSMFQTLSCKEPQKKM
jgi:hypothetical protein